MGSCKSFLPLLSSSVLVPCFFLQFIFHFFLTFLFILFSPLFSLICPPFPPLLPSVSPLILSYSHTFCSILFPSLPSLSLSPSHHLLSPSSCLCDPAVFLLYLPQEPLSFPAGPDTLGSDGQACHQTGVINGEVMDRCAGAVETSQSSFTVSQLLARQREGPRAAILCQGTGP